MTKRHCTQTLAIIGLLAAIGCAPEEVTLGSRQKSSGLVATIPPTTVPPDEEIAEEISEELESCYSNQTWYCNGDDMTYVRTIYMDETPNN